MGERKKTNSTKKSRTAGFFFGIDQKFLGNISDDTKLELLQKAMFLHDENGKETYLFRPKIESDDLTNVPMKFFADRNISLDEEYILSRNRCKETLERTEKIIFGDTTGIQDQMLYINRGCYIYNMINSLMEKMDASSPLHKMPFFYEISAILEAMFQAYGITEHSSETMRSDLAVRMDTAWISELADLIKEHCNIIKTDYDKKIEKSKAKGCSKEPDKDMDQSFNNFSKDMQSQIKDAEFEYGEMKRDIPIGETVSCITVFGK